MNAMTITPTWYSSSRSPDPAIDATLCDLAITLGEITVTRVVPVNDSNSGDAADTTRVSVYPVAEWMAENYWALQYEPHKGDHNQHDDGHRRRHRLIFGRDGFAVPDIVFDPRGDSVHVMAMPCDYPSAGLRFPVRTAAKLPLAAFRDQLDRFLGQVADRLDEQRVTNTAFHQLFQAIRETTPEQAELCQLLGAMGLNPYRADDAILSALENALEELEGSVVRDLCLAGRETDFDSLEARVKSLRDDMAANDHQVDLTELGTFVDRRRSPTEADWVFGRTVAQEARHRLGVEQDSLDSGKRFIDRIGLDRVIAAKTTTFADVEAPVRALLSRRADKAAMAVHAAPLPESRRFDGVRGTFLALTPASRHVDLDRLVTSARTTDQKASRAFAAEILVPYLYLKKRFPDGIASQDEIEDVAREAGVSTYIVQHQADNNEIRVVS
jgi:hypothetical protein